MEPFFEETAILSHYGIRTWLPLLIVLGIAAAVGFVAFWPIGIFFLLSHIVMGFAIGTSALKMNWAMHGVLWGAVFGIFLAISRFGAAPEPWGVFISSVIWGFLVETLATKAFKQPQ